MNNVLHYFTQLDADAKLAITHGVRIVLILIAASVLQNVASRLIRTFRQFMELGATRASKPASRRCGAYSATSPRSSSGCWQECWCWASWESRSRRCWRPPESPAWRSASARRAWSRITSPDFSSLLEDQLRQGDIVDTGGQAGLVEEVTLRYVRMRNFDGHVIFVPNGEIKGSRTSRATSRRP